MANAITKREKKRVTTDTQTSVVRVPKPKPLDSVDVQDRKNRILEWRKQARIAQADNRYEMARDHDYFDGIQWSPEDRATLENRGQTACVFNLIATTVRWVTGTEKRTRVDFRVMPRKQEELDSAETKTMLLKYVSDVNKDGFERSRAFQDAAITGLGWMEDGIRSDSEDEPLFARYESWRNMWYDPLSLASDMSDARFLFREKWVDLDVATLMFPESVGDLKIAANNIISVSQVNREMGNPFLYDDPASISIISGGPADLMGCGTRQRVLLCEAWYRIPEKTKVIRQQGATYHGAVYNSADPVHAWAVDNELASTYDSVRMTMRLMILCISAQGGTVLQDGLSPYWHNRFPFTPIFAYRRGADNSPYGLVRGLRDAQDDFNKRRSKALYLLNSKQVIADKGAVDDKYAAMDEIAHPNGWVEKNKGLELSIQPQSQLMQGHVQLMDHDARIIQQAAGVTDENLGRQTNAISGKAIEARQNQGYTATSDLFDNLRLAIQFTGERRLSLIEQFYDQPKQIRLTGARSSDLKFVKVNDNGLNPITENQADFLVDEQDFRGTIRQAMFDSMLELVGKLPPDVGLKLLAISFEMSDVPMRDEFVRVLREATGMQDPNAKPSPEEEQQQAAQAQAIQQQQQQQQAMQQATAAMQMKRMMADIALIEGKAKEAVARGNRAELDALVTKLDALRKAMGLAGSAAVAPELTTAADQILQDVTAVPVVNNVAPNLPYNVPPGIVVGRNAPEVISPGSPPSRGGGGI